MASLKIIENNCTYKNLQQGFGTTDPITCKSSITCEVFGEDGKSRGEFCMRHGQKVLNETAREEANGKARQTVEVKL